MKKRTATFCFVALLIGFCPARDGVATIYKCVSPEGSVKFQDYPCPANNASTQGLEEIAKDAVKTLLGGIRLNPGGDLPENSFKAYYFNVTRPSEPIATEIVREVRINYRADRFHHIPSPDFMGYWVGRFTFPQATKVWLTLSQSKALSKVSVDGRKVYEGGGNPNQAIEFSKGSHKIEIEHLNHGPTADFFVSLQPDQ